MPSESAVAFTVPVVSVLPDTVVWLPVVPTVSVPVTAAALSRRSRCS